MDNIVDYIVIIFFIVSALASLLKKKKTEEQKKMKQPAGPHQREMKREPIPVKVEQPKRQPVDPFEEIADFLKGHGDKRKSEVDQYFEQAIKKSEEYIRPAQKKEYTSINDRSRTSRMSKEVKPLESITILKKEEYKTNKRARDIRDKLKNPKQIRELIIINEILNKPKALRHKKNILMYY